MTIAGTLIVGGGTLDDILNIIPGTPDFPNDMIKYAAGFAMSAIYIKMTENKNK